MPGEKRVLIVGRHQGFVDELTGVLEGLGCIVTSTLSDAVALDLAVSSDYEALLIDSELSQADAAYLATGARKSSPSTAVITVHSVESVLTQLVQAGVRI
jgi:CheY-like chemotaxis protein